MRREKRKDEKGGRRRERKNRAVSLFSLSLSLSKSHLGIHGQGPGDDAGVLGSRKGDAGLAVFFSGEEGGRRSGLRFWSDDDGQRFVGTHLFLF